MITQVALTQKMKRFNVKQDRRREGIAHMKASLTRLASEVNDSTLSLEFRREAQRKYGFLKGVYDRTVANLNVALDALNPPKLAA